MWLFRRSLPFLIANLLLLPATLTACASRSESTQNTQAVQNTKIEQASRSDKQTEVRVGYQKGTAFFEHC